MDSLAASGIQVLIPPDAGQRKSAYRKRAQTVEPSFGHTKAQPRDEPLSPMR
jgi:hypothetical protein